MNASTFCPDADLWAAELAAHAELPDKRLNHRFAEIAATFADKPLDSIPQACGSSQVAKATYRFLQNKRVAAHALLHALTAVTAEYCRRRPVVLAIHDTTSVNYSTLSNTTGLGPISNSTKARGLYLHSTLAVRPDGVPLGLLHQEYWSRPLEKRTVDSHSLAMEDKESRKWLQGVEGVKAVLKALPDAERPRIIHLMDREGDIHDVLEIIGTSGDGAIIRSAHNRLVDDPNGKAHQAVAASPLLGTKSLDVPACHGRPKRKARLELRSITTTITPSRSHVGQADQQPINWSLVEAREINAPEGTEALHWLLWTTEPATTLAETLEVLQFYKLRWRIEDFHLTLKSGCRAEALELETAERLTKALTIYSGVAVRILMLRDLARQEPEAPCTTILSDDAWKAMWIHFNKKQLTTKVQIPTVKQAILWIGRLGGHLNRKSDGMPGVRTLWRGWRDLTILVAGYRLGRDER
jgi:Transposase DNA-binding/Transposase Tn5 dimerisation domain